MQIVQTTHDLLPVQVQARFLVQLPKRRAHEVTVHLLFTASGERHVPRPWVALVGGPHDEESFRLDLTGPEHEHHGGSRGSLRGVRASRLVFGETILEEVREVVPFGHEPACVVSSSRAR